ncbi:MAG: response regulator transcription factor [Bacteroidetes bacterium]|nr:response regulator transcription factor [Bacteroidota bacterium]MBL6943477.1 response regulator transcription factor [Bacteroidales bacterium]
MKKETRVLLAEDDKNLGNILKTYLEAKGYPTVLCADGKIAYETFKRDNFDFCVFDIMMPEMDGFTLAKKIRKIDKDIPILFLTAKAMQEDRIHGFEVGADDYLTKPFSMEELVLRIKAIIRRSGSLIDEKSKSVFKFGEYTFEYNRQLLIFDKKELKLTSKEAELLKLLCENMNNVLDRTVALNKIWFDDSYFNARSMDVYITKIRKYLKEDPTVELINVHGVGFKLVVS